MWELIRQNRRKSLVLFVVMGLLLVALGYLIGSAYDPAQGGFVGLTIALLIWGIWSLVGFFAGDKIILSMSGAKEVTPDVHPQLFNVVEEMKIAAGLPAMPKVYIIESEAPNAFAIGRKPENCAVAVTAGLLSRLNRDELQGVVAHEVSHINNRDVQFMTFAGIMLGTVVIISHVCLRSLWFGGAGHGRRYRSGKSDKGGGQGQAIIMVVAIVFAILAPILVRLLYLAISRRREYLADASAARLTRYPEGLASALEKISKSKADIPRANKVTAPMYIVNPLKKKGSKALSNLSSTHPPITERIRILRSMASGAGYLDYQEAFNSVKGKPSELIPGSGLKEKEKIDIREPYKEDKSPKSSKDQMREMGDLIRSMNGFIFTACVGCGLKMKIPPDFKRNKFNCPRCGTQVAVPLAQMAAAGTIMDALDEGKRRAGSRTAR